MVGTRQRKILQLMADGYELGRDTAFRGSWWLQKGGLGKGGKTEHNIQKEVCYALCEKGYIRSKYRRFPTEAFELTELGKQVLTFTEGK